MNSGFPRSVWNLKEETTRTRARRDHARVRWAQLPSEMHATRAREETTPAYAQTRGFNQNKFEKRSASFQIIVAFLKRNLAFIAQN